MNELSQQYHLTDLSNFWSRKFDGVKASDILKKKAWDALIKAKVQEQLFNSLNLWPFKNSAELNTEMEKVNAEREKLKTAGKVIYGPVLFTQKSFYNYEFSNAIIKTKDKIFPRPIAETTLLEHYKKLKKTIYANADYDFEEVKSHIETSFIDEAYEKLVTSKIMQATVTIKNYTTNK
nr:hypothetical protein [uncultured Pedobacter sp.]